MLNLTLHNRYRLDSELGQGGMGAVYQAFDTLLDRTIAIKLLNQSNLAAEGRERLLREARAAARLNHPNIVSIYDVGGADDAGSQPFIVMEIVEGPSLYDQPPATLAEVIAIARQICAALDHAHSHGVIHRDLKLENILIARDGTVKLTDFGLARSVSSRLTSDGAILGTVFYLAPELALGQAYDGRADLYALGVMLYELTTHRLPFDGDDPLAVISQHLHTPPAPPRALKPDLPPALDALILRLLEKRPEDRPASAADVGAALAQINLDPLHLETLNPGNGHLSLLDRIVRGRLVGRGREMAEATAVWRRARGGDSQVLLISGEPGIGKSRLARELSALAEVSSGLALSGECYAEGGAPYAPVAQLVQASFAASNNQLPLSSLALADLITIAPGLRAQYTDRQPNPSLDPQSEQQRIFESLVEWCLSLSTRAPTLLIVDDAHWADNGTLILLRHMARRCRTLKLRVLILLTYRETDLAETQPLNDMLTDLNRERLATRLKLGRLSREQTAELLAVMFEEAITPDFLEGIYRETEGNPFFVEEVCKALIEEGQLQYADGRWQRPDLAELQVPQSIRVAIQARVSKLPEAAQDALRMAAVFGREFEFDPLHNALEVSEESLIESLEQAVRAQLIMEAREHRRTGIETFSFAHALIPAALRDSASGPRRHRLHRRAAAALEAQRPDDFETLAYHYAEAGDEARARAYYLKAGTRAQLLYANEDAIKFYSEALALMPPADPTRFAALAARAAVYDIIANRPAQRADGQAMLALAEQAGDDARRIDAYMVLTDTWSETDPAQARIPANQALEIARAINDPVREAHALRRLGWLDTAQGENVSARALLELATARFRDAGLMGEAAASLHILSLALGRNGEVDSAKAAVEESIALSRAVGDRRQEAIGLRRLGIMADLEGDTQHGIQYASQALELHRALGDRAQELNALANLSGGYGQLGQWEEAAKYARLTMELGDAIDASEGIAKGIHELVAFYYRPLGDYGGAIKFLGEQMASERAARDEHLRLRILTGQGTLLAQIGQRSMVLDKSAEVLTVFERFGKGAVSDLMAFVAYVQCESGLYAEARQTLRRAAGYLHDNSPAPEKVNIIATEAYVDILEGRALPDPRTGRIFWEHGLALSRQALAMLEGTKSENIVEFRSSVITGITWLLIELGQNAEALEYTTRAVDMLEKHPALCIRAPEQILYTHARALRLNNRIPEADQFLRRAYKRVMRVHQSLDDPEYKRSWLEDVWLNRAVLADWRAIGSPS